MRITQITRPTGAALPVNTITKGGSAAKHRVGVKIQKNTSVQKKLVKTESNKYNNTQLTTHKTHNSLSIQLPKEGAPQNTVYKNTDTKKTQTQTQIC